MDFNLWTRQISYNAVQGFKGIRQWPINWFTFTIMKNKITSPVDYNLWIKRLYLQFNERTNQYAINVPKDLSYRIKKRYYKTLGTNVNKQSNVPSFLNAVSVSLHGEGE